MTIEAVRPNSEAPHPAHRLLPNQADPAWTKRFGVPKDALLTAVDRVQQRAMQAQMSGAKQP